MGAHTRIALVLLVLLALPAAATAQADPGDLNATILTPDDGDTVNVYSSDGVYEIVHVLENTGSTDTNVTTIRNLTDADGDFSGITSADVVSLDGNSEINWTVEVNLETREANITRFCDDTGTCKEPGATFNIWLFTDDDMNLLGDNTLQIVHEQFNGSTTSSPEIEYEVIDKDPVSLFLPWIVVLFIVAMGLKMAND